jgi:hypothetical protein
MLERIMNIHHSAKPPYEKKSERHCHSVAYALTQWSVCTKEDGWYISPTIDSEMGRNSWEGPFATEKEAASALTARVLRELARLA